MNSIRSILSSLKKADNDFNLINEKDKVVLYLDGTKASLALAKALEVYPYYSKKKFKVVLTAIDYGFNKESVNTLQSVFNNISIIDGTDVVMMMNAKGKDGSTSAFLKLERKLLAMFARENRAKKIALAATHEDSLEHLYKSVVTEGKINALRPKSKVFGSNVSFIRPFIHCYDSNIDRFVNELEVELPSINNPWVKGRSEDFVKLTELIYENRKDAKDNIRKALSDDKPILYAESIEWNINGVIIKKDPLSTVEYVRYNLFKNKDIIGYISYLMIDHHLSKIEFSKLDDDILLPCLDKIIDELLEITGKVTIFFSRPRNTLVSHLGLKKLNIRGKTKFAAKLSK